MNKMEVTVFFHNEPVREFFAATEVKADDYFIHVLDTVDVDEKDATHKKMIYMFPKHMVREIVVKEI